MTEFGQNPRHARGFLRALERYPAFFLPPRHAVLFFHFIAGCGNVRDSRHTNYSARKSQHYRVSMLGIEPWYYSCSPVLDLSSGNTDR